MKKTIVMNLSPMSLNQARKAIQDFADSYRKGIKNAIKVATEELYNKVIANCNAGNLGGYTDAIHWEYDSSNNVGRVWVTSDGRGSSGLVIILNEFGTGAAKDKTGNTSGQYDYAYAKSHGYTINSSGKGNGGWAFPTKEGDFRWTHGIPSKRMFYEAFQDIQSEFIGIVNIQILGEVGNLYERVDK